MAQKSTTATDETSTGFSAAERAAMKERAKELKADARANRTRRTGKATCSRRSPRCRNRIASWPSGSMRSSQANAPSLAPKTLVWDARLCQGRQGRLLLPAREKFKTRYATFGFNEYANLDDGAMWPTSFALKELTPEVEARITALVKKAVS